MLSISKTGTRSVGRRGGIQLRKDLLQMLGPFFSGGGNKSTFWCLVLVCLSHPEARYLNTLLGHPSTCLKYAKWPAFKKKKKMHPHMLLLQLLKPQTGWDQMVLEWEGSVRAPRKQPNSETRPRKDLPGNNSFLRGDSKDGSSEHLCLLGWKDSSLITKPSPLGMSLGGADVTWAAFFYKGRD